jgi:Family of unknown function (DUF6364)
MTTKLTLSLNNDVIIKTKLYASQTGRSLSELVENYFQLLSEEITDDLQLDSKLKKIAGSIRVPFDFDEKKELENYYSHKFL